VSYATVSDLEAKGTLFQWDRANTRLKITVNSVEIGLDNNDLVVMLSFLEGKYQPKKRKEVKK